MKTEWNFDLSRVADVHQPTSWQPTNPHCIFHAGGWAGWIDRNIKPSIDSGIRAFLLHNPGGHGHAKGTTDYQFDQLVHLHDARSDLYTGFAVAFRPLVQQGIRIIAYLGRADTDVDLTRWKSPGRWDTWQARMVESVKPIIDAGCDLGIDASVLLPADSPEWTFIEHLRGMGTTVWVEARPAIGSVHQHRLNWITTESDYQYQRTLPELARDSQLRGTCLRWFNVPPAGEAWTPESTRRWMTAGIEQAKADGHWAGVAWEWMR